MRSTHQVHADQIRLDIKIQPQNSPTRRRRSVPRRRGHLATEAKGLDLPYQFFEFGTPGQDSDLLPGFGVRCCGM